MSSRTGMTSQRNARQQDEERYSVLPYKHRFYGLTDVGRKRTINEDSYYFSEEDSLCIIADGMGGHSFGEIASKMAVENFRNYIQENIHPLSFTSEDSKATIYKKLEAEIQNATRETNESIFACMKTEDNSKRMGTTLVGVYFLQGYVLVAHVGDSRAYVLRKRSLYQLTEDHTVVNRWVKAKQITAQQAKKISHKTGRFVTRALGTKLGIKADVRMEKIQHDDIFLLCSDGLTDLVSDEEILRTLLDFRGELKRTAKTLVSMANARGGKDNITVVLAHLIDAEKDTTEETKIFYKPKETPTEAFVRKK